MAFSSPKHVQPPAPLADQVIFIDRRTVYGVGNVEIVLTLEAQGFIIEQRTTDSNSIIPFTSPQAIKNLITFCLDYHRTHLELVKEVDGIESPGHLGQFMLLLGRKYPRKKETLEGGFS